jgi:hypothetical protein
MVDLVNACLLQPLVYLFLQRRAFCAEKYLHFHFETILSGIPNRKPHALRRTVRMHASCPRLFTTVFALRASRLYLFAFQMGITGSRQPR